MRVLVGAALVALLLPLAACSGAGEALDDEAACPGETCTDDTRARYDAIAALDGVTDVETVARTYGLDEGSSREAVLRASVDDRAEARALLLEVLRELEEWPEHDAGTAVATVTSDPPVEVVQASRESEDLTNPHFEECAARACDLALEQLRERMATEITGLEELDVALRGGVLRIVGSTRPGEHVLAAAAARRIVVDTALRLADRLEVVMRSSGPLRLTLRLDDGLVCEQPPGTTVACEADNSASFEDALSANS